MSASIRISRRTALDLALLLAGMGHIGSGGRVFDTSKLRAQLVAALAPKRSSLAHAKRVRAKKKTRRELTGEIRAEVFERANEVCESLDCLVPSAVATELDHFFGRGKAPQAVRNCWALCRGCHRRKTHNIPSATHWLENFAFHCEEHGYTAEALLARSKIPAAQLRKTK